MILTLKRDLIRCTPKYTPGVLAVDGVDRWPSMEDPLTWDPTPGTTPEDAQVNAKRKTCIPFGHYEMIINYSKKFQRLMPLVLAVPGRDGIRVHWGNSAMDVEGCIVLGKEGFIGWVGRSAEAFGEFMEIFVPAAAQGKVHLSVLPLYADPKQIAGGQP